MRVRLVLALALPACLASLPSAAQTKIAIEPEKVAEGVWAAPTPGGANVGWFLLGDTVIAVDAGLNEEVGRALVAKIKETAGRAPRYLVVTHAHRDHAGGAPAFAEAGAQVLCAEAAAPGTLYVLESAGKQGKAPASRPIVLTVGERVLFLGGPRRAEIYYLGPGHTRGDLVVVLPNDGVLFSGDLAVNGVLPYLRGADVDPKGWEQILPRLAALKIDKMIPGHGRIGPRQGIADTLAYIRRVNEIARKFVMGGLPESQWDAQLHAPENVIENVPVTEDHIANVKAVGRLFKRELEKRPAGPAATPAPTPTPGQ